MSGRFQSRRGNGRFQRNTLENTMGLSVTVCPHPECRRFNPRSVGEKPAENCHACGKPLQPAPSRDGRMGEAEYYALPFNLRQEVPIALRPEGAA